MNVYGTFVHLQGGAAAKAPLKSTKPADTAASSKGSSHKCGTEKPSSPTKRPGSAAQPRPASGRPSSGSSSKPGVLNSFDLFSTIHVKRCQILNPMIKP